MSTVPSAEHESPIALVKLDPSLVAWLLSNVFDIKVPDYHHTRTHATDVRVLLPRTYHADSMVLFCDPDEQPLPAVVLEVQRGQDRIKRRAWPCSRPSATAAKPPSTACFRRWPR